MAVKNKDVVIVFFGNEIKKEPFLIDTDKSIGEKQEILKKESKPQVLFHAMDNTVFGETFNKVLPTTEPYLKAIYNNSHSKSRFETATDIAVDNLELSFKMKGPVPTQDLEQSIKLAAKTRRAPKPSKM